VADEAREPAARATDTGHGSDPGSGFVKLAVGGTAAIVVTSVAAAAAPETFGPAHAVLSVVLFVVGTGAMLGAYALGVARSRTELVGIPGLFLLADDVAPPAIRRVLRGATVVQVVAAVAAASIRPYTEVAFGILAPMFGLGLMGLWAGRYGTFPPRRLEPEE
jgi:hypothetical protein